MINQVEDLKMKNLNEKMTTLQKHLEDLYDQLDNFDYSEYECETQYDEMLDDVYGEVEIAGMYYSTSGALKKLDPTAYRAGFMDYCDSLDPEDFEEYRDLKEEIEELENQIEELEEEIEEKEAQENEMFG